jgi:hypothetical protein
LPEAFSGLFGWSLQQPSSFLASSLQQLSACAVFAESLAGVARFAQTLHVPPSFAQCLQLLQVVHALQFADPVQVPPKLDTERTNAIAAA